jgi:hypothetical protein
MLNVDVVVVVVIVIVSCNAVVVTEILNWLV